MLRNWIATTNRWCVNLSMICLSHLRKETPSSNTTTTFTSLSSKKLPCWFTSNSRVNQLFRCAHQWNLKDYHHHSSSKRTQQFQEKFFLLHWRQCSQWMLENLSKNYQAIWHRRLKCSMLIMSLHSWRMGWSASKDLKIWIQKKWLILMQIRLRKQITAVVVLQTDSNCSNKIKLLFQSTSNPTWTVLLNRSKKLFQISSQINVNNF